MELPQPRAFEAEGRKTTGRKTTGRKTTHDFLSLYSSLEQDPRPPQGGFLRTHDFLQPLQGAGKTVGKEEINEVEMRDVEKPLPPAPAVEHVLPGGIGTYSISYLHQRAPSITNTNDENSDYSSCTRSGFTVWNESTLKKGMTKKDNFAADLRAVLRGMNKGGPQLGRPSQTPCNLKNKPATFNSFLASQQFSEQNNQSFLNMIASSKTVREDDGDLEEEEEEFVVKKEQSLHPKGNLSVKVDGKSSDQKPNTPLSKHSETEQRRRSKINDRFQMLRGIIPHSDQKRDKASFLLEVIEYIQFLQEKVHKYEGSYQGWDNETSKLPWSKCHSDAQGYIDHSQGKDNVSGPALMLAAKFDGTIPGISLPIPISEQNIESNMNLACPKENGHQSENNEKPVSLPMLPNAFPFCGTSNTVAQHSPKLALGRDVSTTSRHQSQCSSDRSYITSQAVASDKSKDEDLTVESGMISISSMYSQGLLNTLTKALENSGVDLSQASISVHVDLGKRSNGRLNNSSASTLKGDDVSTTNQPMPHSITSTSQGECDQAQKRLKTSKC